MKKIKTVLCIAFSLILLIPALSISISAAHPYQTYTYGITGFAMSSPDAYTPRMVVDSEYMDPGLKVMKKPIDDPTDIFVDDQKNVYVVDSKNNRVVVLDRYYKLKLIISDFINEYGVQDEFTNPGGVFVTKDLIYVCDTGANRIVTFDRAGKYKKIIQQPESTLFEEDAVYKPVAVAVDQYDRIFVVSSTTYEGIIVMTSEGIMTGFIGAQAVSISAMEALWRRFQTVEQREASISYISTEFNNIAITDKGFIYVTTSSIPDKKVESYIRARDTTTSSEKKEKKKFAPVKLLNAGGDEIMRRNGFWPPAGEINWRRYNTTQTDSGVSKIKDVAVGPENTWSIIDVKRNKIFTYDFDGNLLFAFGDKGNQLGNLQSIKSIIYHGDALLALDGLNDSITVYDRSEYGSLLIDALNHQNNRQYDKAVKDWTEILKRNSNFETGYIGIGQALLRSGKYEDAVEYFKAAYDVNNYSEAYKEVRKNWISKYVILIPVILIVVIFLWTRLTKYAAKVNKATAVKVGARSYKEEMLYGFHLIFHPFDGFWDLKHEKRGSLRAALTIDLIAVVAYYYSQIGAGYIFNPMGGYFSIIFTAISLLLPFVLFAIANWCLTTLFDGEGSMKDIIIAISYAFIPLILTIIPAAILSNFVTKPEAQIVDLIIKFGLIWTGLLIFVGMMVTHDYTLFKSVTTTLGTILGMAFIMFIAMLFTTLLGKLVSLVSNLILELTYRM